MIFTIEVTVNVTDDLEELVEAGVNFSVLDSDHVREAIANVMDGTSITLDLPAREGDHNVDADIYF